MRGLHPGYEEAERLTSEPPRGPASTSSTGPSPASNPLAAPKIHGRFEHPVPPIAPRRTVFPGASEQAAAQLTISAMDTLSCYAIAVNECVRASEGLR